MAFIVPQNEILIQWIKKLDNTRLPVYKAHRELALQALKNPSNSLREIAKIISRAPTIAFILMREANRSRSSLAEPVQTLENALSRLGLQRCSTLLNSLQDSDISEIPQALRQVWLIGQHLNIQAVGLFSTRMARLWQEIHWGSLLFLSPAWPLLTRHPEFFAQWEQRVLGNNEPAEQVERELLGMPLTALCLGLAEHWQLPRWVIEGYRLLSENPQQLVRALHIARQTEQPLLQQQKLDQQPLLNNWLNRPANTLVFTCGLVIAAHNSWGNEQCLRWQRLISLYLKQDLASVQQTTHQLAVNHARLQKHHDLWQPAQALLWPWATQRLKQPTVQDSAPAPSTADLALWRSHCAELLRSPSPFSNTVQLIQRISQALASCGMQRICIMMLDKLGQQVQVAQLQGIPTEQLPRIFTLAANPVTAHLLKQTSQLALSDSNRARIGPHLPSELTQVFNDSHWLLASLSNGRRVVMLIAADQSSNNLHSTTVQAFKKTLQCIERGLLIFSAPQHEQR